MKLTDNLYFYPEKGMLDCNTYVVTGEPGVIIDPGAASFLSSLIEYLRADGIEPEGIGMVVNTHLHGDHCGADKGFSDLSGARISMHPVQKEHYEVTVVHTAQLFGLPPVHVEGDDLLESGRLSIGEIEFELVHTPGHSPDSISLYWKEGKVLICGDVVFQGNIGRPDLPGGDGDRLTDSIERLAQLDIEYLLPGHMGVVSGAARVKHNFEFIKESILKWL